MNNQQQASYRVYDGVINQKFQQVKDFWDLQRPHTFRNEIIIGAFERDSEEIFRFVADRTNNVEVSQYIGQTLSRPQRFLHLLPRADLTYDHSWVLTCAAQLGDKAMLQLILSRSNPQDPQCEALYEALCEGHYDIVDLLFPVSNIEATMEKLINSEYNCEREIQWLQEKINAAQNHTLQQQIGHQGISRAKKL